MLYKCKKFLKGLLKGGIKIVLMLFIYKERKKIKIKASKFAR